MQILPLIVESWKSLATFPGWSEAEAETGYLWFDANLEINGVVEAGLVLHGGCYHNCPDCHVILELRIAGAFGRRQVQLQRLDWRSLNGGHRNPRVGDSEWRGRTVSNTHFHDFALNWDSERGRFRRTGLRLARDLTPPVPASFEEVLAWASDQFRITNMQIIVPPPWEDRLL